MIEHGPARVAVTITRNVDSSRFVQTVSLAAGAAGDRVVFHNADRLAHAGHGTQGNVRSHRG